LIGVDPARVLRRAGLPADWLAQSASDVDGSTLFRLWAAMVTEDGKSDTVFRLAQAYAHGPFVPPVLAFSSAETLVAGLTRLAVFKPLTGPMEMRLARDATSASVELLSTLPNLPVPSSLELFELVYLVECARTFLGQRILPLAIETRHDAGPARKHADFFGVEPFQTGRTRLIFRAEDADLPLITRSPMLWETIEPGLLQQLEQKDDARPMAARVRHLLTQHLAGGCTTVDEAARRLHVSKRSLQRRLSEEETTFQTLLNDVRAELADRYLKHTDLCVPEISYLLGFRDTSSFFRAFQGWKGTTPGAIRSGERRRAGGP
jgi:AraC-like DNA-binding protein